MKKTNFYSKIILFILAFIILLSCNNNEKLKEARNEESLETKKISEVKKERTKEIDSLQNEILQLKNKKENLISKKKIDLIKSEIYFIGQASYLDHIIIGTKNLETQTDFFKKLGFSVKEGRLHNNGIKNNFIEFADSSEIELIQITEATAEPAKEYKRLIDKNVYGLQFALRINDIVKLKDNFSKLNSDFSIFNANAIYSTLSKDKIDKYLPVFFIQYDKQTNNLTKHFNGVTGISSIWLSTSNIKNTARMLSDIGFKYNAKYHFLNFKKDVVEFTNNHFKIILIPSSQSKISGITFLVERIDKIRTSLNSNSITEFEVKTRNNGKSIILKDNTAKSTYYEFLELNN